MTRHLADHQRSDKGGRVKHFLRLARDDGQSHWTGTIRKPRDRSKDSVGEDRRMVEFLRIERGQTA